MKTNRCLLILLPALHVQLLTGFAQGTGFTYQGRLTEGDIPANGLYDLEFGLYDNPTNGTRQGEIYFADNTPVSNGVFTAALQFAPGIFTGGERWLQIAVRSGAGEGAFTDLQPRHRITAAPYAIFAGGANAAGLTGTLPASALSGLYEGAVTFSNAANRFTGDGGRLTNLAAANLVGTVADARLSTNVALRSGGNVFRGEQSFENGNVGVGAAPTTDRLYVAGNIRVANDADLFGLDALIGYNDLRLYGDTNGGPDIFIAAGGNVGFGTAAPGSRLAVANAGQVDDIGLLSFAELTQEVFTFRGDFAGGGPAGNDLRLSSIWHPAVMTWRGDGNVGVGAAPTTERLYVAGSIRVEDDADLFGLDALFGYNDLRLFGDTNGGPDIFITAGGNVGIGTTAPQTKLHVNGDITTVAVNITSDRHAKEHFAPVDAQAILEKVATLGISQWQYKDQPGIRHIGPMAQDFHAAFQCGPDERHIATVDADGVALVAIQGLYEKLTERETELRALRRQVAELEARENAREARMIALEQRAASSPDSVQQAALSSGGER